MGHRSWWTLDFVLHDDRDPLEKYQRLIPTAASVYMLCPLGLATASLDMFFLTLWLDLVACRFAVLLAFVVGFIVLYVVYVGVLTVLTLVLTFTWYFLAGHLALSRFTRLPRARLWYLLRLRGLLWDFGVFFLMQVLAWTWTLTTSTSCSWSCYRTSNAGVR